MTQCVKSATDSTVGQKLCDLLLLHPGKGAKYCYICLSVSLSARISQKPHGIAIRYLLPVLWITSYLRLYEALCVFLSGESVITKTTSSIPTKNLFNDKDQQVHIVGYTTHRREAKSAIYECLAIIIIRPIIVVCKLPVLRHFAL